MHYSACDPCNRLFVIRHRPSPPRPCPSCRRGLRAADHDEFVARYHAAGSPAPSPFPAFYEAAARPLLIHLDHPTDR